MRLLMTTDTVGGVWTYTQELTAGLLQRGVAIALVTIGRVPSAAQVLWLRGMAELWGSSFRWDVCTAPLEWMSSNESAYDNAESLLLEVVRDFKPHLLHSNQFCFGGLPVSIPRLVVAHSDVLSWADACHGRPLAPSAWLDHYIALVDAGLRGADTVVAPTAWMLNALGTNFRLPDAATVIPNGRTLAPPAAHSERKLQAASVGRFWDEAKNLQLLSSISSPFPILVAGETTYDVKAPLEEPAGCTFLGPLAEEALLTLFLESAIYVCASKYEPFGLAPLEAAFCGCAVVANDIPSLREVWGRGALYFHDASSFSELLAQLASDPRLLAAAQHRSRERTQRYRGVSMVSKYFALYQSMLASQGIAHVA